MTFSRVEPLAAAASMSLVRFGQRTRAQETSPTATVAVTRFLQNNPNRVEFTLVNLGTQLVYFSTDNQPSSSKGFLLPPQGGVTVLIDEDGEVVAYDWYIVSASGTQQLFVQEEIAD